MSSDLLATRSFLSSLAGLSVTGEARGPLPSEGPLASWAARHHLEPQAYALLRAAGSPAASSIREPALSAAASNVAHLDNLRCIERAFREAGIAMVLLKGAALAESAYADPSLRSMSDIDVWVRAADMERASALLGELRFRRSEESVRRPTALQRLAGGEIRFRAETGTRGLVELHWSPFPGWWLRRTTRIDTEAVWGRTEPLAPGRHARRLCAEDSMLQVALHIVGSKLEEAPLRGLVDIAVMARKWPQRTESLAGRARRWRVATATWIVFDLAVRLVGATELRAAADRLRPSWPRRWLLRRLASPESLLLGAGPARGRGRAGCLLLLALVDRVGDALRVVLRTIWPERSWLRARYAQPVGRVRHLWLMLRQGEI